MEGETAKFLADSSTKRSLSKMWGKEERPKDPTVCLLYHSGMQKTGNVVQAKSLIFESSDKFSEVGEIKEMNKLKMCGKKVRERKGPRFR